MRTRITVLTLGLFVIPLLIAILVTAWLLHATMMNEVADRLSSDAQELALEVAKAGPDKVQIREELGPDARRVRVAITDQSGTVLQAHPRRDRAAGLPAGAGPAPVPQVFGTDQLERLTNEQTPIAVIQDATFQGTTYRVVAAMDPDSEEAAVQLVVVVLLASTPVLLIGLGVATWATVGRSLRPVEKMRTAAERISAHRLSSRLPVPDQDDEVGRLATTLNDMLCRLEEGQLAQRRFVSDASHELRSPLASLRTSVQLGQASGTADRWNELAPVLDTESRHLTELVEDLLTLSRADERGVLKLTLEEVDLDDLAYTEAASLKTTGTVRVGGHIAACRVNGDLQALGRVTRNLVHNAVRAAESRVDVSVTRENGHAVLRVEDDGPGVPKEQRKRIFERFVRLDEARQRDSGGSGLGLPITREIVRAHGGEVWVDRSPALGGARFTVRLPAAPE